MDTFFKYMLEQKKLCSIIACLIVIDSACSSSWQKKLPAKMLSAFVTFETNDNGVIENQMSHFIDELPVISSLQVFYEYSVHHKKFVDDNSFLATKSLFKDNLDTFIIVLPEPYYKAILTDYGFSSNLEHMPPEKIKDFLKDPEVISKSTRDPRKDREEEHDKKMEEQFEKLFLKPTNNDMYPKILFIDGHGFVGQTIAGIGIKPFAKILSFLNKVNTKFVYILTCYLGGYNMLQLQSELEKFEGSKPQYTLPQKLDYPIVIRSTAETVTRSEIGENPIEFMDAVKTFLEKPRWYFGKPKSADSGKSIIDVIKIIDKGGFLGNLASIRFPGINSFFRAIDLGNMTIITWLDLQKLRTAKVFCERFGPKPSNYCMENLKIDVHEGSRSVLVYPADLEDMNLIISGKPDNPKFISKIPGAAQHFIGTIHYQNDNEFSDLNTSFFNFGRAPKAGFIENLIFKNKKLKSFITYKGVGEAFNYESIKLFQDEDGKFKKMVKKDKDSFLDIVKPISPAEYYWTAFVITEETRPGPRSIKESSGGNEDLSTVQGAFKRFMVSTGITSPVNYEEITETMESLNLNYCPRLAKRLENKIKTDK